MELILSKCVRAATCCAPNATFVFKDTPQPEITRNEYWEWKKNKYTQQAAIFRTEMNQTVVDAFNGGAGVGDGDGNGGGGGEGEEYNGGGGEVSLTL